MKDVISFPEAIKESGGKKLCLLIGNGFSASFFDYKNLLDQSGIPAGHPLIALFKVLGSVDFEWAMRALEDAAKVAAAYGMDDNVDKFQADAEALRKGLVQAIHKIHPDHVEDLVAEKYESCTAFLQNFERVFSLNYDLILYWSSLKAGHLQDGFVDAETRERFRSPFKKTSSCTLFNLHGGLHLFEAPGGDLMKAVNTGSGMVDTISKTITEGKKLPLYVAEATSQAKMAKINSNDYLRHCLEQLQATENVVFVYGHSADDNDEHIYRAIFNSTAPHLYFGVYQPDDDKIRRFRGQLSAFLERAGSKIEYTLFDSGSAKVWS